MRFALTVLAAGIVVGVASAGSLRLAPARFEKSPGWYVGAGRVHRCPGIPRCSQVGSHAATRPWRDCQDCAVAHRTLASLQRSGVAIFVLLGSGPNPPKNRLDWPPHLRAAAIRGPIEGAPARIGYYGRSGLLRGFTAQLFVYFGRRHPPPRQIARAQGELKSARLP